MRPGERVTIIRKAAEVLAPQGWDEIDLVLSQFGFPTEDEWDGNKHGYLLQQLQLGNDDELVELDAYLHPGDVPPTEPRPAATVPGPDDPWTTGGFRLFLTHCNSHAKNASGLRNALAEHSIEAFVAHETISAGEEWLPVIEAALRSCDALAAWMTPQDFKQSDWCDQEIGFAAGCGKLVVPLRFGLDPYGFIGRYQAITVQKGPEASRDSALNVRPHCSPRVDS